MTWAPGSFVDSLTESDRDELFRLGTSRRLPSGRRLFIEGDRDDHVEVLTDGFVKVTTLVSGPEQLIAIRLPGDVVGELAAVSGAERTATVTACGTVTATVITGAAFRGFLGRRPLAAVRLTAAVGRRLRWANIRRTDFTAHPVDVRLARVLADLAEWTGRPDDAGGVRIGVDLSQVELAELIGAAEDPVQKALRALREAGLVRTGYRRVTVLDADALRGY